MMFWLPKGKRYQSLNFELLLELWRLSAFRDILIMLASEPKESSSHVYYLKIKVYPTYFTNISNFRN